MATKDTERAPLFAVKRPGALVPASAIDAEVFDRIANGSEIEITVKQRRSSKRLRFYWCVLGAVVDATGRWNSKEDLSDALKMACGITELRHPLKGAPYLMPDSVAFSRMSESDFSAFVDRAFAMLAERIGCDPVGLLDGTDAASLKQAEAA